jgi:hypothetical protein
MPLPHHRRLAIAPDLHAALTQAAVAHSVTAAALASVWLQDRLAQERPDLPTTPHPLRRHIALTSRPSIAAPAMRSGETSAVAAPATDPATLVVGHQP